MFKIDSNLVIRLSNGDDVKFSIFVNKGTTQVPIRYAFYLDRLDYTASRTAIKATINKTTWAAKVSDAGIYTFIYYGNSWMYNDLNVNLADYGITVSGVSTFENGDYIKVTYEIADGCYVKFIIYAIDNNRGDYPVLVKTFNTSGTTISQRADRGRGLKPEVTDTTYENVNENHDIIIRLLDEDTIDICPGEYKYLVLAKVIDRDVEPEVSATGVKTYTYLLKTITNKLPIYIINDNYSDRTWR